MYGFGTCETSGTTRALAPLQPFDRYQSGADDLVPHPLSAARKASLARRLAERGLESLEGPPLATGPSRSTSAHAADLHFFPPQPMQGEGTGEGVQRQQGQYGEHYCLRCL